MNRLVEALSQAPSTNAVAIGATVSPFWLPYLQGASETASLFLPLLGVTWLIIQMVGYFRRRK